MDRIKFKYFPNIYEDDALSWGEGVCQCCGKKVDCFIESAYTEEDVYCLCLQCISDGSAAEKFDATFITEAEPVSDPEKREELFKRTPGYLAWQYEYWIACCDDYCQYLGRVGIEELDELGCKDEILDEYCARDISYSREDVVECMYKDGDMSGYLFKCLHCGKYHLWVDAN